MFKKITALLLSAIMILSLWSCKKEDDDVKKPDNAEINPLPIMATENYEITVSMMTYFFNSYYRNFVAKNQLTLGALGLDPTKPLDEQKYSEDYTWQDYFLFYLSDTLKQQLVIAEDAKKNGFELSEEDLAEIDEEIKKLDKIAAESNNATSFIIQNSYGECVNEVTLRKCLELTNLTMRYTSKLTSEYTFTDEEIDEYFKSNANDLLSFSYIRYQVDSDDQDAVAADFSKCTTEESFVEMIKTYAKKAVYDADEEYMQKLMNECYVYGAAYNENSEFAKWAFDKERKAHDIYIDKVDGGNVLVAMALPASGDPYSEVLWKDTTPLHNISSICFTEDEYGNAADAKKKAESVLKEINDGASFEELCIEYEGGTTSNMIRGNAPDAIEDWVFDENRTLGEYGIVTVKDTGTYLIRMEKDGTMAWKYFALDGLTEKTFMDHIDKLSKSLDVKLNNDAISEITPISLAN